MRNIFMATAAAVALTAGVASAEVNIKLEPFVTGVNAPMSMVQIDDSTFWVLEQDGRVQEVADGAIVGTILDLRSEIVVQWQDFDERGTLGLALHPDFANNGLFYVSYTAPIDFQGDLAKEFWWDHTNVVSEFKMVDGEVDRSYERVISRLDWPQFNHNGHWIGFGPDGMLYISSGDGGFNRNF